MNADSDETITKQSSRPQPVRGRASAKRTHRSVLLGACVTLVLGSLTSVKAQSNPSPASTEPDLAGAEPSYEALLDQAIGAFDTADFSRARSLFEQAYALRPNARVLRGMGVAALRLERYSEAHRTLSQALKHPVQPLTAVQREEVTGLLSWMETTLATVRLKWTPAEPKEYELLVDGSVLKEPTLWLSPGAHRVAVHAPGFGALDRNFTLAAEQHEVIELTLSARESSPPTRKAQTVTPAAAAQSVATQELPPGPVDKPRVAERNHDGHSLETSHDSDVDDGVLTQPWFWVLVGAVAAGGVTAAVLLSQPNGAPEPTGTNQISMLNAPRGP
jgi:hypothetical protein